MKPLPQRLDHCMRLIPELRAKARAYPAEREGWRRDVWLLIWEAKALREAIRNQEQERQAA